jgi:thiamine pyrophosphokinase
LHTAQKFCRTMTIELYDDFGTGRFLTPHGDTTEWTFYLAPGQQVSLTAFQRAAGVRTTGLKYPLSDQALEWAVLNSQSNEVSETPVTIRIGSGVLFMYCVHETRAASTRTARDLLQDPRDTAFIPPKSAPAE